MGANVGPVASRVTSNDHLPEPAEDHSESDPADSDSDGESHPSSCSEWSSAAEIYSDDEQAFAPHNDGKGPPVQAGDAIPTIPEVDSETVPIVEGATEGEGVGAAPLRAVSVTADLNLPNKETAELEEENEADESDSDDTDITDGSDASDVFHAAVFGNMSWRTPEDARAECARNLAERFRDHVQLPPDPADPTVPWTDVASGVKLPLAHCAFRGCRWTSDHGVDSLWQHLNEEHMDDFARTCGPEACATDTYAEKLRSGRQVCATDAYAEELRRAYYVAALQQKEREGMPTVGPSIDRRAFGHLGEQYNDREVQSLVCLVCAQIHTQTHHRNTAISRVSGEWLACIPFEAKRDNLSYQTFRRRYVAAEGRSESRTVSYQQPHAYAGRILITSVTVSLSQWGSPCSFSFSRSWRNPSPSLSGTDLSGESFSL
jgi:hypothetical protein